MAPFSRRRSATKRHRLSRVACSLSGTQRSTGGGPHGNPRGGESACARVYGLHDPGQLASPRVAKIAWDVLEDIARYHNVERQVAEWERWRRFDHVLARYGRAQFDRVHRRAIDIRDRDLIVSRLPIQSLRRAFRID
jgi:hypothetical protein